MQVVSIKGEVRTSVGKVNTKAIRREGLIPAVLYGGEDVVHFSTTHAQVKTLVYTPDFKLAEIEIDGQVHKAILKDIQFHPVSDAIMHIDFLRLMENTPIKLAVPIRFVGTSPGVKVGGKLQQMLRRVEIKTTPEHIIDHVKVDISNLELGQSARVRDIQSNDNIEIMQGGSIPVAMVEIPRALRSATAAAAKEE